MSVYFSSGLFVRSKVGIGSICLCTFPVACLWDQKWICSICLCAFPLACLWDQKWICSICLCVLFLWLVCDEELYLSLLLRHPTSPLRLHNFSLTFRHLVPFFSIANHFWKCTECGSSLLHILWITWWADCRKWDRQGEWHGTCCNPRSPDPWLEAKDN